MATLPEVWKPKPILHQQGALHFTLELKRPFHIIDYRAGTRKSKLAQSGCTILLHRSNRFWNDPQRSGRKEKPSCWRIATPMPRRYLLVSRIGRKSLHERWLVNQNRTFDVVLSCYDPEVTPIGGDVAIWEFRPGTKVQGYNDFLVKHANIWQGYDFICLMDEDIDVDTQSLDKMFALCSEHDLKIAQPSLTHDSHFTYAAFLHQSKWKLRYVTYIEMMCPVFRRDALETIAPLYALGYESGIDLIWCNAVFEGEDDFAVLDAVQVRHSEPVGQQKAANGFVGTKRYEDNIYSILSRFKLPWISCAPYSAVNLTGKRVRSRMQFMLAVATLLPAVQRQRPTRARLRSLLVHLKHLIANRSRNIPINLNIIQPIEISAAHNVEILPSFVVRI